MKKVLVTYPESIAGKLISKGFASGFKANGCFVLAKNLKDVSILDLEKFKPDIVFGYDYGFLFSGRMDLIDYLLDNCSGKKFVHYFGDEPNSAYSYCSKNELYDEFCKIVNERDDFYSYIWDKTFLTQIPKSMHLPLAVNCKAYRAEESKRYDITFVGRPLTEKRQKILAALIRKFGKKLSIFSYEKHFLQSLDDMREKQFLSEEELDIYKSAYCGFLTTEKDLADVYFNSKVNLNIPVHGCSGMNYRVFEVLASGGFLLTESANELEKQFIVSKELETYSNVDDLLDKTDFYLKHFDIAQKIAIIGYADVYKKHNFTARVRKILDDIKNK